MQETTPQAGSERAAPRRNVTPTEKIMQMEKRTLNCIPKRPLQCQAVTDPVVSSSARVGPGENPFLVKNHLNGSSRQPKSPEGLAHTYSSLNSDTLGRARDKINPTSRPAAKLRYDPQKRPAKAASSDSVPQLPAKDPGLLMMETPKVPIKLPPPLQTTAATVATTTTMTTSIVSPLAVSGSTRDQPFSRVSDQQVSPTGFQTNSDSDGGQQRLSFRSAPRSPEVTDLTGKPTFFQKRPSIPSNSLSTDKNGSVLPMTPLSQVTQHPRGASTSTQLQKHPSSLELMEDAPPLGPTSRPDVSAVSIARSAAAISSHSATNEAGMHHPRRDCYSITSSVTANTSELSQPAAGAGWNAALSKDARDTAIGSNVHATASPVPLQEKPMPIVTSGGRASDGEDVDSSFQQQHVYTIAKNEEIMNPLLRDPDMPSNPQTQPRVLDGAIGGTGSVPVAVAGEEEDLATEAFQRKQEWLQVPTLFYLFANLIELQELQQNRQAAEEAANNRRNGSFSMDSVLSWDEEKEAQLINLKNHVSYSVFEVDGILLNSVFASWSQKSLRSLVSDVTKTWVRNGPESSQFDMASFQLLDAISADCSCTVRYTYVFSIRKYVGNMDNRSTMIAIFSILALVAVLCIIFLGVFGRHHVVPCAVLSAVLGVAVLILYSLALLVLHHNAYADTTATFFRNEALTLTKTTINQDVEEERSVLSRMSPTIWPIGNDLNHHAFGAATSDDGNNVPYANGRRHSTDDEDGFISIIGNSTHHDDSVLRERLERDRQNALLMANVNYDKHQQSMQHHQEQALRRRMDVNPLVSEMNELAGASSEEQHQRVAQRVEAENKASLVAGISADISVTALVWCQDQNATSSVASSLWDHNFLVFNRTLSVLDNVYHQGSERFKVFLLHAADLVPGSSELEMAKAWIREKRPVFFFSRDVRCFPPDVPLAARLELPFSENDICTLLMSGIGVDEEADVTPQGGQAFKVPQYTLGRRLGGGAYGNVFEAVMEDTGAKCAVKRMYLKADEEDGDNQDAGPSSQLRDIAQEVEIMSSLNHPNIVKYMFCERDDNCISIFMELCSSGSLATFISSGELTDSGLVKRMLADIIGAVVYLHNKRIVHRDLKPDNVLFRDGRAKVTDFGTAVLKRERGDLRLVKGTFAYMAPEILCGEPYGKACDVWSIGCIAAEVLAVELPQRALGLPEMCDYYRKMGKMSALEIECSIPVVKGFLCACLQRDPLSRETAIGLLQHEMLQPESTALNQWLQMVVAARPNNRRVTSDLDSEANDSLQSSQILTPN